MVCLDVCAFIFVNRIQNKAVVFLNWVYNYIRFDREARLIMRPYKKRNQVSFTSDEL